MLASVQVHAESSIDEQSVTLENGQTIHYYSKGDPKAPLIMFLHGFPEFGLAWKDQLEEFGKDHFAGCSRPERLQSVIEAKRDLRLSSAQSGRRYLSVGIQVEQEEHGACWS
jgi:hypothetical protein